MLGWFSRHLNWTIVILTVCINVISYYLVDLFLYVTKISWWGPVFPPGTLDVLLPAFTSFAFDADLLLADILLIVGFCWILSKKNRSQAFLLFFIAFIVVDIPTFLSYIIEFDLHYIMWYIRLLAILIWAVGWFIILGLKNKSIASPNTE